jgi:putative SOS response-associated peptidase YedK
MCGRYALVDSDPRMLGDRFGFEVALDLQPRYNIAPTDPVPVVRLEGGNPGRRVAEMARWDLFGKRDGRGPVINIRAETAAGPKARAPFSDMLTRPDARVLMLADAFYEWLKAERPKEPKVPIRYTVDDGVPFAFAGLRTASRSDDATRGVALFTTEPNALVASVHNRMPVILAGPEAEAAWLDPSLDAEGAAALLRPLDARRMRAARASRRLGDVRNDDPSLWEEDPPPEEQDSLF